MKAPTIAIDEFVILQFRRFTDGRHRSRTHDVGISKRANCFPVFAFVKLQVANVF
jgi:hypothetical protein